MNASVFVILLAAACVRADATEPAGRASSTQTVKPISPHDDGCSELVPLVNPSSGALVGHKDPKTGNLVFYRMVVTPESLRSTPASTGTLGATLKMMDPPPPRVQGSGVHWPIGGFDDGLHSESAGACVPSCWHMSEGGASCSGCCEPVDGNACYCWESCTDFQYGAPGR